jgi:putative membrane protein
MKHKLNLTFAAGVLALGSLALVAQDTSSTGGADRMNNGGGSPDQAFMIKAAQGGLTEVELGNVAKSNAQSDAVKQFGQRMVDDHSKANDELKSLAAQKNVTLPTSLDAKHQSMKDKMSGMKGAGFDKAYMRDMVNDHRKDVSEFQKEADNGKDPDVKAWAAKTLPTLKDHLKMAEQTYAQVRNGGSGGNNASSGGAGNQ